MTDPTPRCPWCSAELPAGDLETCPSCKATLSSPSGAEPDIKGVTSLDPMAIIQARADVARPRNRIMSFITGDVANTPDPTANAESLAPPPAAVRREMRRLEIEAERADLVAESVALKTDVVVEMGISLSALAGADPELAAAEAPEDEAQQVEAEHARLAAAQAASAAPAAPAAPVAPATTVAPAAPAPPAVPVVPTAPPAPAVAADAEETPGA